MGPLDYSCLYRMKSKNVYYHNEGNAVSQQHIKYTQNHTDRIRE